MGIYSILLLPHYVPRPVSRKHAHVVGWIRCGPEPEPEPGPGPGPVAHMCMYVCMYVCMHACMCSIHTYRSPGAAVFRLAKWISTYRIEEVST